MRQLAVLFIHFIATLARLLGPSGVRSLVAESHAPAPFRNCTEALDTASHRTHVRSLGSLELKSESA
jgi:hypothetical protein